MKVDINDRPQRMASHTTWHPYAVAMAVSAALSAGLIYLDSTGWGVTVDLQKLKDAFVVSGNTEAKSWNDELPREQPTITPNPKMSIPQKISLQPKHEQTSAYYVPSKGIPLVNWDVHIKKFNSIFIQHPACNPHNMTWTQMECSNFRARAMKRFGAEWNKGNYWNGSSLIENKTADERVNSELRW